ncbi:forkhead box protein A2 [Nannizzia gypsea CBS 118893]|uniref:Forkhead box protein A2 n=1 Tax=Arthroderma gypseum (strain ATCC MYA-4604 / CBS 118893) TaxID=535722 RepID=E5R3C1_ARTGP|nr:forkhead box protein A2 [Nannizzia gypsea CBS 118893]EFQ97936.1 forkhead box protein A2 [Nannizzia gypsea CBS 118893]
MAPSVAKRRTRRREVDLHDDPVDMDALDSSPTRRSVKKRKVEHTSQPDFDRTVEPASADENEDDNENDNDNDNEMAANQDLIDSVIANLAVAREPVAVMALHSNARTQQENKESVEAYAKIAGRDWTYYVKTLHVNIGRPPDRDQRLDVQSSPITVAAQALPDVHIDLGPGKFVSRLHAEIYYDRDDPPCWRVRVNGRNGVRVNNAFFKRGTATQISCGDILEIANTQMMFVTPRDKAVIDPTFIQQAQNGVHATREADETAWDGSYHSHPTTAGAGAGVSAAAGEPRRMSFAPSSSREQTAASASASASAVAATSTGAATTTNGSRRAAEIANAATVTPKRQTTPSQRPLSRDTIEPSSKVSPMYNRGLMMESTEEIDYSEDAAKDIKPPFSYANMIAQAIFSTEEEKLSLSNIYKFIMQKYAFYRHSQSGWQNSIRHNLSLNKAFQKVPRRTDEPGKGMKWQIVPEHREEYWKKQAKKSGQSSAPASPIGKDRASSAYQPINGHVATNVEKNIDASAALAGRPSPQTHTTASPGYHSFSVAPIEAYTPDRGSRNGLGINGAGTHDFEEQSPLPNGPRHNVPTRAYGLSDNAVASPPVLSSSYYDDAASSMITPAPLRQQPRLAPPSTAQVPSRYMQLSSPAQFWKLADIGNTPARPMPDISPLKPSIGTAESSRWKTLNPIPSSSPPPANLGSPTKPPTSSLRGRGGGLSPLGRDTVRERESSAIKRHQDSWDEDDDDNDGDDTGFDLARGFQPIGSFHRQINNAARAS